MSAPGLRFLPANREFAHVEELLAKLEAAERLDATLRIEHARREFRGGLVELETLTMDEAAIAEWSRRTFRSVNDAFMLLFD